MLVPGCLGVFAASESRMHKLRDPARKLAARGAVAIEIKIKFDPKLGRN